LHSVPPAASVLVEKSYAEEHLCNGASNSGTDTFSYAAASGNPPQIAAVLWPRPALCILSCLRWPINSIPTYCPTNRAPWAASRTQSKVGHNSRGVDRAQDADIILMVESRHRRKILAVYMLTAGDARSDLRRLISGRVDGSRRSAEEARSRCFRSGSIEKAGKDHPFELARSPAGRSRGEVFAS